MINEVVSLDVVRDAVPSPEHAQTQAVEAGHGPQPPQGGAGLHGTIAAAAQRGGERGGDNKVQRSKREAMCIRPDSGECCNDDERPEPRPRDDASGAHHADRACVGGEEGEEEQPYSIVYSTRLTYFQFSSDYRIELLNFSPSLSCRDAPLSYQRYHSPTRTSKGLRMLKQIYMETPTTTLNSLL